MANIRNALDALTIEKDGVDGRHMYIYVSVCVCAMCVRSRLSEVARPTPPSRPLRD
jgi:hypothetical protein